MKSLLNLGQYRRRPLDCCISDDLISRGVFLWIQERTVPSTGYLICSATMVETSRSTVLATSSSFWIIVLASRWGPSNVVKKFLTSEASVFPSTKTWACLVWQSRAWSAWTLISHTMLSSSESVLTWFESSPGLVESAVSSSHGLRELMELYSVLDVLTDAFDWVSGPHIRRNYLINLPIWTQSDACWIEVIRNLSSILLTVKSLPSFCNRIILSSLPRLYFIG